MTIEFFWTPGGPFASRCLTVLAVKKLAYQSRQLDITKQENRAPSFLAISPNGMLPVLKDGDIVVRESQAIMFYLDRAYPAPPLYGETPADAGAIMQEICEQQSYADPVLSPLIAALFFNRAVPADELQKAADRFTGLLIDLDKRLSGTGWLKTEKVSAADINLFPLLRSVCHALARPKASDMGLKPPDLSSYRHVSAWVDRLEPYAGAEV